MSLQLRKSVLREEEFVKSRTDAINVSFLHCFINTLNNMQTHTINFCVFLTVLQPRYELPSHKYFSKFKDIQ